MVQKEKNPLTPPTFYRLLFKPLYAFTHTLSGAFIASCFPGPKASAMYVGLLLMQHPFSGTTILFSNLLLHGKPPPNFLA